MWIPRHILVLSLAIPAPAVVAAQGHAGHAAVPASPAAARPSDADLAFIHGMIAHHAQAVEMVALVPPRSARREIRLIAERIDVIAPHPLGRLRFNDCAIPADQIGRAHV